MPVWKTDCGKEFRVNLSDDLITQWKEDGCRLCLFKDNPDIRDENSFELFKENLTFFKKKYFL